MFSLTLLLSPYSIPHCHSFLFSALPFLCAAYTVTLTFVRLTTDVHLMKALMEKTKHLSKESTKKRTANGANETVDWRRKTDNQSRSSSSSSSNKTTKSIDLFTTCPLVHYIHWDPALYDVRFIWLYCMTFEQCANSTCLLLCWVVLYYGIMCVCVFGFYVPQQHTLHSEHIPM